MAETSIEWTDRTWNPTRGCSRVSEGCRNCYAEKMAGRFSKPGLHSHGFAEMTKAGARWTGRVEFIPSKATEPLRWKKPQRVFVNSMSDLFHSSIDVSVVRALFGVMALAKRHTFQILTKRPARALKILSDPDFPWGFAAWPLPNVWLGTSVEDQATADDRLLPLVQAPAAVHFVSYEPALGPVDFGGFYLDKKYGRACLANLAAEHRPKLIDLLQWVIVGGESGPGARPFDVAWARSTVAQCRAAGVPVFVKQLGALPVMSEAEWAGMSPTPLLRHRRYQQVPDETVPLAIGSSKGGDMAEWPEDLRVREFPA